MTTWNLSRKASKVYPKSKISGKFIELEESIREKSVYGHQLIVTTYTDCEKTPRRKARRVQHRKTETGSEVDWQRDDQAIGIGAIGRASSASSRRQRREYVLCMRYAGALRAVAVATTKRPSMRQTR
jgi:hypothetical protein